MITLSKTLLRQIEQHGEETFPEECCGALLGEYGSSVEERVVTESIPIDNVSEENKKRRFVITPLDYMKIEKTAIAKGKKLLGFYHSHPNHPAKPSQIDLNYAWPNLSYPIVSIMEGKADITNSFTLKTEVEKELVQEELIIID